jgi:mannosyl-3-phosphoglycerate phosphatase
LKTKTVVFADLDGTFLDDKYSYQATKPIVNRLAALGGSIVFCSSKTRSEIEYYQKAVGLNEPFVAENGAAIFIPKGYFSFRYPSLTTHNYNIIRLGTSYDSLRRKLSRIKQKTAAKIIGFGDMALEELARDTGLTLKLAKLAKKREHDEPFRIVEGNKASVLTAVKNEGLSYTQGGRYFHLLENADKGKAVSILKSLYCQMFGKVDSFGIGDGPNDLPMLKAVEKPFLVEKKIGANSAFMAWKKVLQLVDATAFV